MEPERAAYLKFGLAAYLVWIVLFQAVGTYAVGLPTRDITLALDRHIPVWPGFIWPYMLCYIFPFLPLAVVKDWHRLNQMVLAIVLANMAAFLVYVLWPIAFPHPALGTSLSDRLLGLQFKYDFQPGANKLPSLHVTYAGLVFLVCLKQGLGRLREALVLVTAGLISISTLFVKQHVVLDVVAGVALTWGAWLAAGKLYPWLAAREDDPRRALRRVVARAALPLVPYTALLILLADLYYRRIIP